MIMPFNTLCDIQIDHKNRIATDYNDVLYLSKTWEVIILPSNNQEFIDCVFRSHSAHPLWSVLECRRGGKEGKCKKIEQNGKRMNYKLQVEIYPCIPLVREAYNASSIIYHKLLIFCEPYILKISQISLHSQN